MTNTRTIAVVTSSRADWGHVYWPLHELRERARDEGGEVKLIVIGAHLASEFGESVREIENAGFAVDERIECLLSSDSDVGMAKTIGLAILGLTEVLSRMRPDLLLIIADRYEMLAPASVACALRIPIAHIEGGEVSEGAIDHVVRNALTMMSHIHLVPTELAAKRVEAMGEEPWRIHRTGAPSLDHLKRSTLPTRTALERTLGVELKNGFLVVVHHPVTVEREAAREAHAVFEALAKIDRQIVMCYPNPDAGGREIAGRARALCAARADAHLFVNLDHLSYWALLRECEAGGGGGGAMVGNSSSGIMEAPSLELPVVNIGRRQDGRERARNIIDCPAEPGAIVNAISKATSTEFKGSLAGMVSPYGDGSAGEKIAEALFGCPLGEELLIKKAMDVCASQHPLPLGEGG
ncbi:UDP-N-acetylglucosamine 2-epimerase (hydrolyzing) [Planctomycetaceae bacterium AH-315-I19]|nr:UDP-N-acetylglucosamine 2-epimerase (hydrolyzing) [Planctomycetaceae bacterium AH-315-I19]